MAAEDLEFKVQGSNLDKGARKSLAEAEGFAAAAPSTPQAKVMTDEFVTTDPVTFGGEEMMYGGAVGPEVGDDLDAEFLGPTRYPNRPITNGAPFGPGADFVAMPDESDQQFLGRVAERMLQGGRQVPDAAKQWALRVLVGE